MLALWKRFVVSYVGIECLPSTLLLNEKFIYIAATTIGVDLDFQNNKNVKMLETMES